MKKKDKIILGALAAGAIGAAIYMVCRGKNGKCCDVDLDKQWKKAKRHATDVFAKAKEATEGWQASSEPNK